MVGVAQKVIYENGAEYEGLPMYVFSEESTRHAISRSRYRTLKKVILFSLTYPLRLTAILRSSVFPSCSES